MKASWSTAVEQEEEVGVEAMAVVDPTMKEVYGSIN
jgi:hypothetical protein